MFYNVSSTDQESVNSEEADGFNNVENIVVPELPVSPVPVKEAAILQSEKVSFTYTCCLINVWGESQRMHYKLACESWKWC